MNFMTSENDH